MSRTRLLHPAPWLVGCLTGLLAASCGNAAGDSAGSTAMAEPTASRGADRAPGMDNVANDRPLKKLSAEAQPGVRPSGLELPPSDPILGAPLVVDGELIPFSEIKRRVVLGPRGRAAIEFFRLVTLTDQEAERRLNEGATEDQVNVSEDEVLEAIAEGEQELRERFPDEGLKPEHLSEFGGRKEFLSQVELSKRFLRVFTPDDVAPENYPAITLAAFNVDEQSKLMFESLKQDYERTQAGGPSETNPIYRTMVFNTIRDYLIETSNIEKTGLPEGVLMRINGEDVMVEDVWDVIAGNVSISDIRGAKQWIVNMALLEKDLKDTWLTAEEAEAAYAEHAAPFEGTLFDITTMATMIKKFPSEEVYQEYRVAFEAFKRSIADDLTPQRLKEFADQRTRNLIGQMQVDVDVILLSAFNFKTNRWKENGWDQATQRAEECLRRIVKESLPWQEALEEYSDFYDPPVAPEMLGTVSFVKAKGRFRAQNRNQLMQHLDESEYWMFLNGRTITDTIFFQMDVGKLTEPIRGPYGWYIPYLLRRTPSPQMINLPEDQIIDMAEEDYVMTKLAEHAQQLIGKHQVYGLQ